MLKLVLLVTREGLGQVDPGRKVDLAVAGTVSAGPAWMQAATAAKSELGARNSLHHGEGENEFYGTGQIA